ncbi:hypothetical protein V5O48_017427 [Marasmius crinis-equi]|uniref:Uncharacterized protein n=1 Tax=Marasmius crinis-equi TaxID=585013 RepID=A0ABR3EP08_9AGAR
MIADKEQDPSRHKAELCCLESILGDFKDRTDALQTTIAAYHKGFTSIIQRIPRELWHEVFLQSVQLAAGVECSAARYRTSDVCTLQQEVIDTNSGLRSTAAIPRTPYGDLDVIDTPHLEFHLEHSKHKPLDVFTFAFAESSNERRSKDQVGVRVMNLARGITVRDLLSVLPCPELSLLHLEYLILSPTAVKHQCTCFYEVFRHVPKLLRVTTPGIVGQSRCYDREIRFDLLQKLNIRSLAVSNLRTHKTLFQMLGTLPKLRKLAFNRPDTFQYPISPPVLCQQLQHLSIGHHEDRNNHSDRDMILASLKSPNLQSFVLNSSSGGGVGGLDVGLREYNSGSSTSLSLTCDLLIGSISDDHTKMAGQEPEFLKKILRDLPNITVVEGRFGYRRPPKDAQPYTDLFMELSRKRATIAPRLKSFLIWTEDTEINGEALKSVIRMLEVRMPGGNPSVEGPSLADVCFATILDQAKSYNRLSLGASDAWEEG